MTGFITAITTTLTAANFWAEITAFATGIAGLVIFAFGYRVLRRVLSGASRGKAKI